MTDQITSRVAKVKEVSISQPSRTMDVRKLGTETPDFQLPTVAIVICIAELKLIGRNLPHEHVAVPLDPDVLDAIEEARRALPDVVAS
ncbi:MAG TPA: hypothetical protein VFI34_01415 [Candidatus Limnocylindrales bacterium]|nr:hypothetical protein [Candidatus Limnocylindrales bacterium]